MSNFKTKQVDIKTSSGDSKNVLPDIGHIIPFAGPSNKIPSGWALCDGTNGTPDLRGKIPGGKANISPGSSESAHSHTHTANLSNYDASSAFDDAPTLNAQSIGNNNVGHTHGGSSGVYPTAWGYSGPANRSNGTQANVIGHYHSHGYTGGTTGNTGFGGQSADHSHSFSGFAYGSSSSNTHSHSKSAEPVVSGSTVSGYTIPSVYYVNFIMKVA